MSDRNTSRPWATAGNQMKAIQGNMKAAEAANKWPTALISD